MKAPESRRKVWVEEILEGFRSYRQKNPKGDTALYLSDMLQNDKEWTLVGFVPKIEYIKVEGRANELDCIWEHPHMNPQLLYKHVKLPVFIIAGPGLRFNDSVLKEVGLHREGVRGITG